MYFFVSPKLYLLFHIELCNFFWLRKYKTKTRSNRACNGHRFQVLEKFHLPPPRYSTSFKFEFGTRHRDHTVDRLFSGFSSDMECLFASSGTGRRSSAVQRLDHNKFADKPGQAWDAKKQCELLLLDAEARVMAAEPDTTQRPEVRFMLDSFYLVFRF